MIVLVDDERSFRHPPNDLLVFRNSKNAIDWLESLELETVISQLWLDHDLGLVGGRKDSILPFVRKIEELVFFDRCPVIEQVIVHSANPVGGEQVFAALKKDFSVARVAAGDYLVVE